MKTKNYCEVCEKMIGIPGEIYIAGTVCFGHLRPTPKSFENLEVGYVIYDRQGVAHKIVKVNRHTEYVISEYPRVYITTDFENSGFTLSHPDPVKELKGKIMKLIQRYK